MNFVCLFSARRDLRERFDLALRNARLLDAGEPLRAVETDWARAAVFPRADGSGSGVAVDRRSGSWLLVSGSWFAEGGLKSGDEKALLELYLVEGASRLARRLDGRHVVVIGDARTREAIAITDPIAGGFGFERALADGGGTAIGGSSLLLATLGDAPLDPLATQEYLRTGVIYEERTLFRPVRRLPSASIVRWDASGARRSCERWWKLEDAPRERLSGRAADDALHASLVEAGRRVGSLGRVVCDVTAGYDSRAAAVALSSARVPFTATVTGAAESVDVTRSRAVAQALGAEHVWHAPETPRSLSDVRRAVLATDGEYDPIEYATIRAYQRKLAGHGDVSLNGAAGEIARGLWWHFFWPRLRRSGAPDTRRLVRIRFTDSGSDAALFAPDARLDLGAHFGAMLSRATASLHGLPTTVQVDAIYLGVRIRAWQGRIAAATDRYWQNLSPFQMRGPLETSLAIRATERFRSLAVRRMLARVHPAAAAVPLTQGYPAMPFGIRSAPAFLRALPDRYLGRAFRKLAGVKPAGAAATLGTLPSRMHLQLEEEVRQLLRPRAMRTGELLDPVVLARFLDAAAKREFPYDAQWSRLLGMEAALDLVARVRVSAGAASETTTAAAYEISPGAA